MVDFRKEMRGLSMFGSLDVTLGMCGVCVRSIVVPGFVKVERYMGC